MLGEQAKIDKANLEIINSLLKSIPQFMIISLEEGIQDYQKMNQEFANKLLNLNLPKETHWAFYDSTIPKLYMYLSKIINNIPIHEDDLNEEIFRLIVDLRSSLIKIKRGCESGMILGEEDADGSELKKEE